MQEGICHSNLILEAMGCSNACFALDFVWSQEQNGQYAGMNMKADSQEKPVQAAHLAENRKWLYVGWVFVIVAGISSSGEYLANAGLMRYVWHVLSLRDFVWF